MSQATAPARGLDLARFSAAAFDAVEPATDAARVLTAGLEAGVLGHVMAAVEAAFDDVRVALRAAGHAAEAVDTPGELTLRAQAGAAVLRLVVHAGVGVRAQFRDAVEDAAADAPSADDERFYRAAEAAAARARADGFDALGPDEQLVLALHGLEAEIANGGFDQYFRNSASDHVDVALAGLKAIGAVDAYRVLRDALKALPSGRAPADRDARIAAVDAVGPDGLAAWERLSVRYFAVPDGVPALVDAYLERGR